VSAPAIILVEPQLGENTGAAARVMANFGLKDLRLVAPRFAWPNARSDALAAGAFKSPADVSVRLFKDLGAAIEDLNFVLAATARPRETKKPVLALREAAVACRAALGAGPPAGAGVMFGGEQAGLTNESVALADAIVTYPVDPEFSSLNLAQAVAVFSYEWGAGADREPPKGFLDQALVPAPREELAGLIAQLEDELDAAGFFWPPIKTEQMKLNLRSTLARAGLTSQEITTLRGAIKSIANGPRRRVRELRAREADAAAKRSSES
jgi:tRNA/rRNA methyltransferase